MASNSPLECGVCNEEFNEDEFCPRILLCSHTLCTECIKQLIAKGTKTCPFCRAAFVSNSAKDIIINHAFLDLINFFSSKNSKQENASQKKATPLKKRINDFKKETADQTKELLSSYQDMQILVETSLRDIDASSSEIKDQDVRLRDEILRRFTERLKLNEKHVDKLNTQKQALLTCVEDIKTKKCELENVSKKLEAVKTLREAGSIVEEAEETNNTADGWRKNTHESLIKCQQSIRSVVKNVSVTKMLVNDTMELLEASQGSLEETDQMITNVPSMLRFISSGHTMVENFEAMGESVFKTLVRQRRLFAVQQHGDSTRTAIITLRNDKIFLHHLRNESPPPNVNLVEYNSLLSLEDSSSRLTFFELVAGETTLGHLLIRLAPDTVAARNFALLCTGETGPSYAQTNMIDVKHKGSNFEGVSGGDYEFNNGTGGKPLIPGFPEVLSNAEYQRPWEAGTVWGRSTDLFVHFIINTRSRARTCYHSFGIVEDGLEVLKNAIAQCPDIKEVKVQDCGAVLSYPFKK